MSIAITDMMILIVPTSFQRNWMVEGDSLVGDSKRGREVMRSTSAKIPIAHVSVQTVGKVAPNI